MHTHAYMPSVTFGMKLLKYSYYFWLYIPLSNSLPMISHAIPIQWSILYPFNSTICVDATHNNLCILTKSHSIAVFN